MKNSECVIIIYSDNGFVQTYEKGKNKWIQTTNDVEREATPEQVLSHILPLLENENSGTFKVKVIKK